MSLSNFFDYLEDPRLLKLFHYSNAIIENAEEIGRGLFVSSDRTLTKIFLQWLEGAINEFLSLQTFVLWR